MTRRISAVLVAVIIEETDATIDTTLEELDGDELSRIVPRAKPFLAKCSELVADDARRRRAVGK